ncbi:MAG: hypothetical protein ABI237_11590 [Ginsengibacter sp.]
MERKEKIELLKGISKGTRKIDELLNIHDPVIIDENDNRPIIIAIKANGRVILAKDFERLRERNLITGFAIDLRNKNFKLLSFD